MQKTVPIQVLIGDGEAEFGLILCLHKFDGADKLFETSGAIHEIRTP